jgi:hypothetical protein
MKHIILITLLFLSVYSYSQIPEKRKLVADGTWIMASGKEMFRIITTNDSISNMIVRKFWIGYIHRYTNSKKKDRFGEYYERSFYFKNTSWNELVAFINKLN